jgi:hypothetical protein
MNVYQRACIALMVFFSTSTFADTIMDRAQSSGDITTSTTNYFMLVINWVMSIVVGALALGFLWGVGQLSGWIGDGHGGAKAQMVKSGFGLVLAGSFWTIMAVLSHKFGW